MTNLINTVRALRDQLREAIADRDSAWLTLAVLATSKRLDAADLRRVAERACPYDPWDLRIDFETNKLVTPDRSEL